MQPVLQPTVALLLALVLLAAAAAIWYVLVRPVPERAATGVITGRDFRPAERVRRSVARTTRSPEYATKEILYSLPDRYVYRIRLGGDGSDVYFTAPAAGLPPVEVGRAVRVVYTERAIPLLGRRRFVKEMTPTG